MDLRKLLEELKRQLPEKPEVMDALEVLEGQVEGAAPGEELADEPAAVEGAPPMADVELDEIEDEAEAEGEPVEEEAEEFDMTVPPKKAKKKLRKREEGEQVAAEPVEITGGY